jgi:hypothetical protein
MQLIFALSLVVETVVVGVSFEAGLPGVVETIMATHGALVIAWACLVLKVTIIVWLNCLVLVECLAKERL